MSLISKGLKRYNMFFRTLYESKGLEFNDVGLVERGMSMIYLTQCRFYCTISSRIPPQMMASGEWS